jgi:hypothetical protein
MRSHACEATHNVLAVITVYWTASGFRYMVAHAGQGIQAMHMVPFDTVPTPLHGAVAVVGILSTPCACQPTSPKLAL